MSLFAEHILCVDDEPALRERCCALLEELGYRCVSASVALAEVLLLHQKFDLLVLSVADDHDLNTLESRAEDADLLVLTESADTSRLPSLVAERLQRRRNKMA